MSYAIPTPGGGADGGNSGGGSGTSVAVPSDYMHVANFAASLANGNGDYVFHTGDDKPLEAHGDAFTLVDGLAYLNVTRNLWLQVSGGIVWQPGGGTFRTTGPYMYVADVANNNQIPPVVGANSKVTVYMQGFVLAGDKIALNLGQDSGAALDGSIDLYVAGWRTA